MLGVCVVGSCVCVLEMSVRVGCVGLWCVLGGCGV